MNKSQLIEEFAEQLGCKEQLSERYVNHFFSMIKSALAEEDKVEIRDFGVFTLKKYDGYTGRNPKTGTPVEVPPKKLPYFKPGKDLKERVKNGQ